MELSLARKMFGFTHLTILFSSLVILTSGHPSQHRLYNDLMTDYNPLFIPMLNNSDVQVVMMEANLHKIIEVDEDKGVLTTLIWLDMSWDDDYLRFIDFGNFLVIKISFV